MVRFDASSACFRGSCLVALVLWSGGPSTAAVPAPTRELTDPRGIAAEAAHGVQPVSIADLYYTLAMRGASWSPDGKSLAVTMDLNGRYNVWRVSADGGWPVQMARSEDRQYGVRWSPDGKWIVFESDHGGDEMFDLYAIPASGGQVINLTGTDDESERAAIFSEDNGALAFTIHNRSQSTIDIAWMDWGGRTVRRLTHESTPGTTWNVVAISPDARYVYAGRSDASDLDESVWRIDVADGKAEEMTPHRGKVSFAATGLSPDGRWLAMTSNEHGGGLQAQLLDLKSRRHFDITHSEWEANARDFSPDGSRLAYAVNADGRSELFLYDMSTHQSKKLDVPAGANSFAGGPASFSSDGKRVLYSHQDSTTPGDYWTLDLASGARSRITHSAIGSIDFSSLPASRLVHYRSFDGTVISALLWVPKGLERNGTAPAVVIVHGGPQDQTRDVFNRMAVALASRGYLCIAPNIRGSSGYGTAFLKANYKDLGGGDLRDAVYASRFLVATGYVDTKKIGITGDSYGGFMALMAVGRTPDVWAAAVDEYGITNWLTEQQHEEPRLQAADRELLGDPVKDRTIYERSSPTTYFAAIRAPVLLLQGENDIRDPRSEADSAVERLQVLGKTVAAHYYPGEGHGFRKRENQIDALERTIAWFDKYLKGH